MQSFSCRYWAIFLSALTFITDVAYCATLVDQQPIAASSASSATAESAPTTFITAAQPLLGDNAQWQWPINSGFPHIAAQGLRFRLLTSSDKALTWQSSDQQIASIDRQGVVTLHQLGKATIQVTDGQQTAEFIINPTIWLSKSDAQLRNWQQANQYCHAQGMQLPDIATLTSAEWASPADQRQASHFWDEWGNLTIGLNQGGAGWLNGLYWSKTAYNEQQYYAVELLGGGRFSQPADMNLFVVCQSTNPLKKSQLITGINALGQQHSAITPATNLAMGYPYSGYPGGQLQLYVRPSHEQRDWQWQSSNPKVATIDQQGIVTLHQRGQAMLTLTDTLHKQFDQYQLNINKWYELADDKPLLANAAIHVCQARHLQLTGVRDWQSRNGLRSFLDEWGLPEQWPQWTAADNNHASPSYWTVDNDGLVIVNQQHLQVANANQAAYLVCRHQLSKPELSAVQVGQDTHSVKWPVNSGFPQTAFAGAQFRLLLSKANQLVRWSSSDQQIATVSAQGVVTFHQPGQVTIYVNRYQDNQLAYPITIKQWFIVPNLMDKSDGVTNKGDDPPLPSLSAAVLKMSWPQAQLFCQQRQAQLPLIEQLTSAALASNLKSPQVGYLWDEWQAVLSQRNDIMPQLWSNSSRANNYHDVLSLVKGSYHSEADHQLLGTVCLQSITRRNDFWF